ncbi:MAG: hypothetical protein K0R38_2253 [Polyangiaceae bacterium]|jgi:hypothetical protein|nr:hypothetical protein [Polyangiaceae bacterium]
MWFAAGSDGAALARLPSEDSIWDEHWAWPPPRDPRLPPKDEALLLSPLLPESWSPQLAGALVRYAVPREIGRPLLAPRITLPKSAGDVSS